MLDVVQRRLTHKPVRATRVAESITGYWSVSVHPPGQAPVDITFVRGLPTKIAAFGMEDPFGPTDFSFSLPGVTYFDRAGSGDLAWLVRDADVDLTWHGPLPSGYPFPGFRWEGYIASFDWSGDGLSVSCAGATHQMDNYQAKPEYPQRPLPYEWAITRQFRGRPDLRLSAMRVEWPAWWKTKYTEPAKSTPAYLVPNGVKSGDNWTGMLTRSTGSWQATLTGYVQSLLTSMYTEKGRWTIDLDPGRMPVLRHRDIRTAPADDIAVIDPAAPEVKIDLSQDFSQSLNVAYGQGTSLSGVAYTGMEVSADGSTTTYQPLAALRQVEPATDKNGWFQRSRMRKEILLQLQQGLDENDARKVALAHLARFGDPGLTGTVTLGTDPTLGGVAFPRALLRAGMSIQLPKLFGDPAGVILHVTRSSYDAVEGTATLTVDSKYRDQLTIDEVRLRGRDALSITRMLVAGTYQPPVSDQLVPWNYATGSGYIPSGPQFSALRLFRDMPADLPFPWTDWTTQRPPKAAAWRDCYVRLGPRSVNANNNWTGVSDAAGSRIGIPVKLSQAGQIRLIQLAAYDRDGHVLPVDFHFSLYNSRGVNYTSMPSLPSDIAGNYPEWAPAGQRYAGGQHYPFFPNAWESYNADGTITNPKQVSAVQTSQLIRAWGSSYEKAGHWPGSSAAGDPPTGLLVDEAIFGYDCTRNPNQFDPQSPTKNATNPDAGVVYLMIYCDLQQNQEVFFAGRMFRVEPGTGAQ